MRPYAGVTYTGRPYAGVSLLGGGRRSRVVCDGRTYRCGACAPCRERTEISREVSRELRPWWRWATKYILAFWVACALISLAAR